MRRNVIACLWAVVVVGCGGDPGAGERPMARQTGAEVPSAAPEERLATLGAGCFWCVEAVFQELEGVLSVTSGYAGGHVPDPTYRQVCDGLTGHAEVAQVRYDPKRVSYAQLLEVFFRTHDPTTLNRQGADVGTQYRSAVYFHDEEQQRLAERLKQELDASGAFEAPIVTEIAPLDRFWPAEDNHQDYYANNPSQGYCAAVVRPKVEKFRKAFAPFLKRPPADDR